MLEVQSTAVGQDQGEKNRDLEGGRETENTARGELTPERIRASI